ncbi:MAG: hypothetical protein AB7G40_05595 [Hyphomonadaceae bacterium]
MNALSIVKWSAALLIVGVTLLIVDHISAPKPLRFVETHARVFSSPLTDERTVMAKARVEMLADDVLLSIDGRARTIRAVRTPPKAPTSEEDFVSLLPMPLSELTREPFSIRLTSLAADFPEEGDVSLTFVYEKAGRQTVNFPIVAPQSLRDGRKLDSDPAPERGERMERSIDSDRPSTPAAAPQEKLLAADLFNRAPMRTRRR